MRRPYQIVALLLILGGGLLFNESQNLRYYTPLGPGPGFFPSWLSGGLIVLGLCLFVSATRRESTHLPHGWLPDRKAVLRMLAIPGALLWTIVGLERLGFCLTMGVFFLALVNLLGRQSWLISLGVSVTGSVGVYLLFTKGLGIPLPTGWFGF